MKYRVDIKNLLDHFKEQVKRIEITHSKISSLTGPSSPGMVDTRDFDGGSPRTKVFKQLTLPRFSGTSPVPKGEGSYDQYMFQLKGFRTTYTDDGIKSGMIGSITDYARDYLDFIGFNKELTVLISALEERYRNKIKTTDKIQQEFYQSTQDWNKQVQQFAGWLEFRYKKLANSHPDRYNTNTLKERLFYGMTQHLHDSMRYLYKQPETTYEELLASAKEAEAEWMEHKTVRSKATTATALPVDSGKKEREELKMGIDILAAELNKKEKECQWKKKGTPTNSPRESPKSKGPGISAAGPFIKDDTHYNVTIVVDGVM